MSKQEFGALPIFAKILIAAKMGKIYQKAPLPSAEKWFMKIRENISCTVSRYKPARRCLGAHEVEIPGIEDTGRQAISWPRRLQQIIDNKGD